MDEDRKFRLIQKGETDLYLFSLLKDIEEKMSIISFKMDIIEKRLSLFEDLHPIEETIDIGAFDDICEKISQFVKRELEIKFKIKPDFVIAISDMKHHYFDDFSNDYGYSKYSEAFDEFCKIINNIIEIEEDDCPYHK